ncbi:ATP-dependent DNA ligase, partial [Neoconidiobolus thromboides FSU 785]
YSQLCDIFEKIEANPKRLEKISILTKFFLQILKSKSNNEKEMSVIVMCIYLCINRIAPEYAGLELGIGEQVLIKAVVEATGTSSLKIKERLVKVGDLGEIAQEFRSTQKTIFQPKPLSLPFVFNTLKEIAQITGRSSMNQKIGKIKHMLISCQGKEAKYLIRSLEGKLRIGLAEKTVLVSLAQASVLYRNGNRNYCTFNKEHLIKELEEASEAVKTAYSELPNYELIVPILIEKGYEQLAQHCKLVPGIPIKPMLAHPTKGLDAIFERFTNKDFICEYKYDGERAQIHLLPNGEVHIYSRNSEDMTSKYPDIIVNVGKFKKENVQSFVMDCEAVAWDKEEKKLLPFQILSTRKRKDVREEDIKVKVVIFGFDLLYFNEKSLLRTSLDERKQLLAENFNELDGMFNFAKSLITNEVEDIQTFLDNSISDQCEGLMVKLLKGEESSYEPSKRSRNWLKVKKDYLTGIGDSVDLTVIGAYTGKGKRTGVYGGYLLACYDKDLEQYQSICKIGTGFSEEVLKNQFTELQNHIIQAPKSYYNYDESKGPDIWFEPAFVWEVKAADLSISPVYKAAIGIHDEEKGISLRFPRFIRVRGDKTPENCTDSKQIAELYQKQLDLSNKKPNKADIDNEDIY